jgi:hypothetical protein
MSRADVNKQIELLNKFAGLNLSLSSYRPGNVRLYQVWQNEGSENGKPLHRHHEPIKFVAAFLEGIASAIDDLPCCALGPQAGQTYRDDQGNMHQIIEVTSMFNKPCIKYEASNKANFVMFAHYVDVKALHRDSNNQFWFKEPLTDSI